MFNFKKYFFLGILSVYSSIITCQVLVGDVIYEKATSLKYTNPDSSAYYFEKGYMINLQKKDTTRAVNFLIELSDLNAHFVNYGKSYDGYWEALLLADKSKDSVSIAKVYQGLGWLYSFYKRDKEALKYFNLSIAIRKKFQKTDYNLLYFIQSDYFAITSHYRVNKNYKMAKVYLDSCYQMQKLIIDSPKSYYLEGESAYLLAVDGKYDEALLKLSEAESYFEKNDKSYLVIIYTLYGNVLRKMGKVNEAILYYKKALNLSYSLKKHLDYRLMLYQNLSESYLDIENIKQSYDYLLKAKNYEDDVFGRRSLNNQHLLEIKDKYRVEKDRQSDLLKLQRIEQLENEERVSFLKTIILTGAIIFLVLFGYLIIKFQRNKYATEKKILTEKQQLKLQQQSEILELKNKELTESALRLIEKDEFIGGIKKKLSNQKENVDVNVIRRMLKTIQGTPTSNWNEFEARFTAINQSFYDKLKKDFPELSQTDQKICALVKLNFPSKDMAKLLGISVESVHTSRYRLRRKLGLERNDNLEEFINSI